MVRKEDYQIPDYVLDKDLYKEAFLIAKETYKKPSAYRSMFIARKYKQLGGKYDEKKKNKDKGQTTNWLKEKWVQIKPYVEDNKEIKCGANNKDTKACRPLKKTEQNKDVITMGDIIKKYGKKKVIELTDKKLEDMDGRLDWEKGTFTPSSKRPKVKSK